MSLLNRFFPEFRSLVESPLSRAFSRPLLSHHSAYDPFSLLNRDPFFSSMDNNMIRQPAIDVKETDKEYIVEAEVPGVKKEDVQVEVMNENLLVIGGHVSKQVTFGPGEEGKSSAHVQEHGNGKESAVAASSGSSVSPQQTDWIKERVSSSFRRTLSFPHRLDASKMSAQLKDGILRVQVPKEEAKLNRIQVN